MDHGAGCARRGQRQYRGHQRSAHHRPRGGSRDPGSGRRQRVPGRMAGVAPHRRLRHRDERRRAGGDVGTCLPGVSEVQGRQSGGKLHGRFPVPDAAGPGRRRGGIRGHGGRDPLHLAGLGSGRGLAAPVRLAGLARSRAGRDRRPPGERVRHLAARVEHRTGASGPGAQLHFRRPAQHEDSGHHRGR